MNSFKSNRSSVNLLLTVNSRSETNKIIQNILSFFDVSLKTNESHLLLNELNFIRFIQNPSINQANNTKQQQQQQQQQQQRSNSKIIHSPSYSLVLITNNDKDDWSNVSNEWKYHHKVELKDEREHVIARQVFFELKTNTSSIDLPLFCKSNTRNEQTATKKILRLNINCRNFGLMLIFYRLLFDKYANFSKKYFSVFVLNKLENYEFQFSLKYDENLKSYSLNGTSLMYFIDSHREFCNIIHLLNGLVQEVLENKVYLVNDPDGNQVYLVDSSNGLSNFGSNLFNCDLNGLADIALDDEFNMMCDTEQSSTLSMFSISTDIMNSGSSDNHQKKVASSSSLSCSSSNSSSTNSEITATTTSVNDSAKDSGHWSIYSRSPPNFTSSNRSLNNFNDEDIVTSSSLIDNQYNNFCHRKIAAAKSLSQKRRNNKNSNEQHHHQQQEQKQKVDLQYISPFIECSMDDFEGLLNLNSSTIMHKAKSVSFVNQLGGGDDIIDLGYKSKMKRNQLKQEHERAKSCLPHFNIADDRHQLHRYDDDDLFPNKTHRDPPRQNEVVNNRSRRNQFYTSLNSLAKNNNDNNNKPVVTLNRRRNIHKELYINEQNSNKNSISKNLNALHYENSKPLHHVVPTEIIQNQKPFVGITPQTRLRKTHTLHMIRSTKMPLLTPESSTLSIVVPKINEFFSRNTINKHMSHLTKRQNNVLVLTDEYNNKFTIPIAKF